MKKSVKLVLLSMSTELSGNFSKVRVEGCVGKASQGHAD